MNHIMWVYDIETYKNVFTMYIGNCDTRKCYGFEISDRRDDREELFKFLRGIARRDDWMVGYNNLHFDYPVLHFMLKNQDVSSQQIFNRADKIINAPEDKKFDYLIPKSKMLLNQIDLYKIHHFDNVARSTSLKVLEFNMRSDNIEDLPYKPGTKLSEDEIDVLLKYNKHDMYQTYLFYLESKAQIEFRFELSRKYKRDFINHNDTKIGKDYFIMKLEEEMPGSCYENRKPKQTIRDEIALSDCILPYIQFKRPEFNAVLDWFKGRVITQTKGVLTDLLETDIGDVSNYAELRKKSKKCASLEEANERLFDGAWVEERELKSGGTSIYLCHNVADNLNVFVDGLKYVYGTGGLHASVESQIVRSDDEYVIVDKDVTSYYPSLAIKHRVYPAHLSEKFCDIYEDVFNQRKEHAKGTPENAMMKLALNGVYGDSNNKFSPFYDPQYTMTITISGQLSLCMLAEMLLEVDGLEIIQCNTDGLTYKVARDKVDECDKVCNNWEEITQLILETAIYDVMAIRDVNNYIAVYKDGGVKRKGAYEYEIPWHANHSALVVPKAAEAALVHGKDIEEFVINHDDKYDFMLRAKIPRSMKLVFVDDEGNESPLQNVTRYYVSNDGVALRKIMPPLPGKDEERRNSIQAGQKVTVCNDINDYKGGINYSYYINEAKKLVDPLLDNN